MNILIVKLSAIGDVIHTLPSLNALRKRYPAAKITWLVEEAASDFVKGHRALDRVIVSKRKKWIKGLFSASFLENFHELLNFVKELRDTKYDLIIDFQTLMKSGILVALAKGKRKAGYGKGMEHMEHSYIFLDERIPPVDMNNHAILRNLMLLESLGIKSQKIQYDLPVFEEDREKTADLLKTTGLIVSKPVVAVNPVAKWETKLWDNKKFAKLGDRLVKDYGAEIIFTGSKDDLPVIEDIISHMQTKAANMAGKTTLKMLAAVFEQADLVISTDTGPMHVAAATGTPVVAIFGPTAPWRTGPFGSMHQVVRAELECSPCFKRKCNSVDCMRNISVDQVLSAVSAVLEIEKSA
ncbi:MAG: lipopolysaccharide heptosyltransferase I [Deltaproteobacteria bacterium]|nr:lipopolysaccharide heptosyltransferase I [Deltaproteobacteria bacterium]